jgi:hypothetical protein
LKSGDANHNLNIRGKRGQILILGGNVSENVSTFAHQSGFSIVIDREFEQIVLYKAKARCALNQGLSSNECH